ncbi:hypothetical protein ACVWYN_001078 [Pedobacter sp. UYP24]
MKKLSLSFLLALVMFCSFGQDLKPKEQKTVTDFIEKVKQGQKETLATQVSFPLKRQYPLPSINDKQSFLSRYNEVFDEQLIKLIVNSNPSADWSAVGWRGIMLKNGIVWLDYNGQLSAVNYQSVNEKQKRSQLIKQDKASLHYSLSNFKEPILICETSKFKIRVDDMGGQQYRYASWKLNSKKGDKPELIILKGKLTFEGSGGNHKYEFKNSGYVYTLSVWVIGEEGRPAGLLTVYKGKKLILKSNIESIAE